MDYEAIFKDNFKAKLEGLMEEHNFKSDAELANLWGVNRSKISRVIGDDIEVRYILDLREFPGSPYGDRVVHDISVITGDPEVELVCETMGGSHPAYEFSVACMKAKSRSRPTSPWGSAGCTPKQPTKERSRRSKTA